MVHYTTLSLKKDNYRVTVFSSQLMNLQVLFLHLDTAMMHPFLHIVLLYFWSIDVFHLYFSLNSTIMHFFLFNGIGND